MALAATDQGTSLGQLGGEGLGPFANIPLSEASGLTGLSKVVSSIIGFLTIAAGIWFLIQFLIGGLNWISSGGDKTKLQSARDRIINALIGILIVAAAWAIVAIVGQMLGVDFLITDPEGLIKLFKF